jgi:hypothetical protein
MTEPEHRYPTGWVPYKEADWREVTEVADITAWRFCPPCGAPLIASEFRNDDPHCSVCKRPYIACPCGCIVNHETGGEGINVAGRGTR